VELSLSISNANVLAITNLYLRAAGLHLRLSAFFDSTASKDYPQDLMALFFATTAFLDAALNIEMQVGPVLIYATNYIFQMMLAAGFALLKLLNSFFANHIDIDFTKSLFNKTIWAIRKVSVTTNDLPNRLAEVLAQLWRNGGGNQRTSAPTSGDMDSSLQLKVRCRMSMSLVFDSVWRWREEFQQKGRPLESEFPCDCLGGLLTVPAYLKNPTNPESTAESSATSVAEGVDPSLAPPPLGLMPGNATLGPGSFGEANYEVFDPLNWMLDGLVDFPYSYTAVSQLEAQGMA
jgi:hypothetical protein